MRWDIFCKVIDNHGDIGVCWRLAADLASRGEWVRLWVDDPSALAWMAPQSNSPDNRITVTRWTEHTLLPPPGDVWIEAFGCEIAPDFIAGHAVSSGGSGPFPLWINLEYLSAEFFVERVHGLPSPVMSGPGKGLTKHFFYPGFTPRTGGLLRELDLSARQANFKRRDWVEQFNITVDEDRRLVSLFCYEPPALDELFSQLAAGPHGTDLLVTAGRAQAAVTAALQRLALTRRGWNAQELLKVTALPLLSQREYDHLLWACDFNFVRGEDSLVRALWAGKPFVWQIYPQSDQAHHAKLDAFLDQLDPPPDWLRFQRVWNGLTPGPLPALATAGWSTAAAAFSSALGTQPDLTTQLCEFVAKKR